jgi:hypothetical protein
MITEADSEYARQMRNGAEAYQRCTDHATRHALAAQLGSIELATNAAVEVINDKSAELALLYGASVALRAAIESTEPVATDAREPTSEAEQFIARFDSGIDAFFPEGIAITERMTLFDLAITGRRHPNGHKHENAEIYQAREEFIAKLTGKRLAGHESYHGISLDEMLKTAAWLHGRSDAEAIERGWSLEPRGVFAANLSILRRSQTEIDTDSSELSQLAGISQPDVLAKASRGLYRFGYQREQMVQEMEQMAEIGIFGHIQKRPDLLNFPITEILKIEARYVEMGIPVDIVRKQPKLYVYKPSRIAERVAAFVGLADLLAPANEDEKTRLKVELTTTPRLLVDNSAGKIERYRKLLEQYATPRAWEDVVAESHPLADGKPRQSALNNLLRADLDELTQYMRDNPTDNIFVAARKIVNAKKLAYKKARTALRRQGHDMAVVPNER